MIDSSNWNNQELGGGRYRITSKLGEGGMGAVYKAWDRHLDSEVVIKVPRTSMLQDPQVVQRFQREIRSLVRLAHPHIVKVTDVGEHQGCPYVVMQYLSGGSLKDRQPLGPDGKPTPMPPASVLKWLGSVAEALDFIHSQQFIHRDIKPANILFDGYDNVHLGDFGVAKGLAAIAATDVGSGLTAAGMTIGTPGYMAPELIMGQPYDGRVDQYALGITVYELLVGRSPFQGLLVSAMLVRQTTDQVPAPHQLLASIPVPVSQIIQRAIHKDAAHRFATCQEFAAELTKAVSAAPARAVQPAAVGAGVGSGTAPLYVETSAAPARAETMPARQHCPLCQQPLRLPERSEGRRIRCPKCQGLVNVSADGQHLTPAASQPTVSRAKPETHRLTCPTCSKQFALTDAYRGKRINCSGCRTLLDVAADMSAMTVAAPGKSAVRSDPNLGLPSQAPTPLRPPAVATVAPAAQVGINTPVEQPATPPFVPQAVLPVQPVRRGRGRWLLLGAGLFLVCGLVAAGAFLMLSGFGGLGGQASTEGTITRDDVIVGMMNIEYGSRKEPNNPEAIDVYVCNLRVQTSDQSLVEYAGRILRRPRIKDQPAGYLKFDIQVTEYPLNAAGQGLVDKKNPRGKISGHVPLDAKGQYAFADLLWQRPTGAAEKFEGDVQGKLGGEGEKKAKQLSINVGGQPLTVEVQKADPLIFKGLRIPGDYGLDVLPATLRGELTYNYDSSSYLTEDLTFTYEKATDKVQGAIFWNKDAGYPDNGKSEYLFNLAFNPKTTGTGSKNDQAPTERDLLNVTKSMPHLSGTVSYQDKGEIYTEDGDRFVRPHTSRVDYHLHANKLTPHQIHNFLKMWLLMSGPVNDE